MGYDIYSIITDILGITGIEPFYFHMNREKPWLDIPTLLQQWLNVSQIKSGYLFPGFNATDQPKLDTNVHLVGILL